MFDQDLLFFVEYHEGGEEVEKTSILLSAFPSVISAWNPSLVGSPDVLRLKH